jgi:methionyl-tRNA formyltransferase
MSSKKPLFAFFGTPSFATTVLDALERHGLIPTLIVTAPDKPAGRGMELAASPVKRWAMERGIDVLTPATLRDETFLSGLQNTEWDVFVVAAYAKLIPKNVLEMPRRGVLNVHPSLLPKFRGPSPALSAILADERATGISIMLMNEKMDEGPIIAQAKMELEEEAWPMRGSLFEELLAQEGGNLLAEVMPFWIAGTITPEPQNENEATFTKKFTDADSLIDLAGDARQNYLKIRAFDKTPRAHCIVKGPSTGSGQAKRIIITDAEFVGGSLVITRVIPEGKKEMPYQDFLRGQK